MYLWLGVFPRIFLIFKVPIRTAANPKIRIETTCTLNRLLADSPYERTMLSQIGFLKEVTILLLVYHNSEQCFKNKKSRE